MSSTNMDEQAALAGNEYRAKCVAEFNKLAASPSRIDTFRIAVILNDGGTVRKDFFDWETAASMYRANILYGSPVFAAAFQWTDKRGWILIHSYAP